MGTDEPRVTLITTFRNAASYLPRTIASARAQTFGHFVHLLVDDGSTDGSLSIARAAAKEDDRFIVTAGPPNGRRAALATAHDMVRTEFVAWVDADDWLEPQALERTLAVMDAWPGCGFVFTDRTRVDADGKPAGARPRAPFSRPGMLVDFATFHFRLIRTAALAAAGGIGPAEIGIDYDLCLRLTEVAPVVHLAEPLYNYRIHPGQMSRTQRDAQQTASAAAVRNSIARQRLAMRLDVRRGRFVARPTLPSAPKGWLDHTILGAKALARRRSRPTGAIRTATVWSGARDDLLARSLADGLHSNGVAVESIRFGLPGLLRAAWSGRAGDLLVMHALAEGLGRGSPAAERALLRAALARARAQGSRIAWCVWSDVDHPALDELTCAAVVDDSDVVVVHPRVQRSVASWGVAAAATMVSDPGHLAELQPWVSRDEARRRLGIPADASVVARLGRIDDEARLAELARMFVETDAHLLVCTAAPARGSLGESAVDASNIHYLLRRWSLPDLATVTAAADVGIVEPGPAAAALTAALTARGRPVFTLADPRFDLDRDLDRDALAGAGREAFAAAMRRPPAAVAEMLIARAVR